ATGDLAHHPIAGDLAENFVHRFEVVDIDACNSDAFALAPSSDYALLQLPFKAAAVGDAGKAIQICQLMVFLQQLQGLPLLCKDVGSRSHKRIEVLVIVK